MFAVAGLASFLSDGMEHYLLYRRNGYKWPRELPVTGVIIGAMMRATLAMVGLFILSEPVTGAITSPAVRRSSGSHSPMS